MSSTVRFGVSLPLAAIVATLLFWLMPFLIATGISGRGEDHHAPPIDFVFKPRDEAPIIKDRQKPDRPSVVELPTAPVPESDTSSPDGVHPLAVAPPQIEIGGRTTPSISAPTDGQAVAIVHVQPQYPESAVTRGIEGWVRLGFTVSETGTCEDIVVLAAEPSDIFNRAAVRALERWRYRPRIDGGRPVK